MNTIIVHNQAMALVDKALFAKKKGDKKTAKTYFKQAFELEKQAALGMPIDKKFDLTRCIYLRSAAKLALDCQYFEEAKLLILKAFNLQPPKNINEQLTLLWEEILNQNSLYKLNKTFEKTKNRTVKAKGLLQFADNETQQIKVQDIENAVSYTIIVPKEAMAMIVRICWNKIILVEGREDKKGRIILEYIEQAA